MSRKRTKGRLLTGFVTRLTRRVPLVEQELLTLPEHLSSPPVISGVRVTRSFVFYVCFVDRCLPFCTFFLLSLCCLFLLDIRIMIAPLVFSNSAYICLITPNIIYIFKICIYRFNYTEYYFEHWLNN